MSIEEWGLVVAVAALVVAAASALFAKRASDAATLSARQAKRSADAAERSAGAEERLAEIEHRRDEREQTARIGREAPDWDIAGEGDDALLASTENELVGVLRNTGMVIATVTAVVLDLPNGGRVTGQYRTEPPGPASGGWQSRLVVHPGMTMAVKFETTDGSLGGGLGVGDRPRLTIDCASDDLNWQGRRTVELLRRPADHRGRLRWSARKIDR
jgi:hypothetical protein